MVFVSNLLGAEKMDMLKTIISVSESHLFQTRISAPLESTKSRVPVLYAWNPRRTQATNIGTLGTVFGTMEFVSISAVRHQGGTGGESGKTSEVFHICKKTTCHFLIVLIVQPAIVQYSLANVSFWPLMINSYKVNLFTASFDSRFPQRDFI